MKRIFARVEEPSDQRITSLLQAGITDFIVSDEETRKRVETMSAAGVFLDGETEILDLNGKGDEERIKASRGNLVFVKPSDWKILPIETLISKKGERNLYAVAEDCEDAETLFEILEKGVDGILLQDPSPQEVERLTTRIGQERFQLRAARVKMVENVGSGERVCVDTTSLLRKGEGLLVGNFCRGLFLIHAENLDTEWVSSRPFRVNCGAVHCYVLCDGVTKYLSELKAGDRIRVVSESGGVREACVGRSKTERRPLTLVSAEVGGDEVSVIVQNAETTRFVTPVGCKNVSELRSGDEVLIYYNDVGRHFGVEIKEFLEER